MLIGFCAEWGRRLEEAGIAALWTTWSGNTIPPTGYQSACARGEPGALASPRSAKSWGQRSWVQIPPAPPSATSGTQDFLARNALILSEMTQIAKSPYKHLLDDPDFRRWVDNMKRGSATYGYEVLRRMGYIEKRFKKSPKDFAKMSQKEATNFILDMISKLESEKKSGSYISNLTKALRSWFEFNEIHIQQKIKISNRDDLTRFADERPPTQEELRKILNRTDVRMRVAATLVAFSGVRLEVLGNYLGDDGLKIRDLPELTIGKREVDFSDIPTMIVIRKNLSKTKKQYFSFLSEEGCDYLKEYLDYRLRAGEELTLQSPVITPSKLAFAGRHIRTTNIGDVIRKCITDAGFDWRPYVLRRYFDTRLMMAEADGLIIRDWRVFWMGHKGDMEAVYTVSKGLPKDVIKRMRDAYKKAAEKYLTTRGKKELTGGEIVEKMTSQMLVAFGYSPEELKKMDVDNLTLEQVQELIQKKTTEKLLNGNSQKVVPLNEVKNWVVQGWEYVDELPNGEAIIRLPT
jgi:integrase